MTASTTTSDVTSSAPAPRERKAERPVTRAVVLRTRFLTPHMVRVVLGGEGLADFVPLPCTDQYVKLRFPAEVEGDRPRLRTYTIRAWDPAARELSIDFVVHGDEGLAGPWAAAAQPGDEMTFVGPGGGYAPPVDAPWHLLVGDESAMPAIAAALDALPADARVKVFLEVGGPTDELALTTAAQVARPAGAAGAAGATAEEPLVTWVHRGTGPGLLDTVAAWRFPDGTPSVFLHGDATLVKELRRYLRSEHSVPAAALSASGYWRRGRTEEGWRSEKAQWKAAVEQDEQEITTG